MSDETMKVTKREWAELCNNIDRNAALAESLREERDRALETLRMVIAWGEENMAGPCMGDEVYCLVCERHPELAAKERDE